MSKRAKLENGLGEFEVVKLECVVNGFTFIVTEEFIKNRKPKIWWAEVPPTPVYKYRAYWKSKSGTGYTRLNHAGCSYQRAMSAFKKAVKSSKRLNSK